MNKMNVMVVGSGAREHALTWKLAQSPLVEDKIFAAPGNPGMASIAKLVPIKADDIDGLYNFAVQTKIDLVVIGPEAPLADGLADRLEAAGIKAFGPKAAAARLESSKPFAKDFMARHNIPTAAYRNFTNSAEALAYLAEKPDAPIVVKAAGLAQGKGVTVAQNRAEAEEAVRAAMNDNCFGEAGREVVIEDFIDGEEVTILSFCDGRTIMPMPPVQDHKRVGEGDTGPNTGGMGAYSPVAIYTPEMAKIVDETVIQPTMKGLLADGLDFRGCVYFGLIMPTADSPYKGPQVIEYNVRLGDPETEVLMPLLKSDLVDIACRCAEGNLAGTKIEWCNESSVCVVIASGGYPGKYPTGLVITEEPCPTASDAIVFHAGTALNDDKETVTAGGRVMTVAASSATLEKALEKVYDRVKATHFEGCHYRKDIAHRELARRGR